MLTDCVVVPPQPARRRVRAARALMGLRAAICRGWGKVEAR